jgi:hypothetical protein
MWSNLTSVGGVTDAVTLPEDGTVSLDVPEGINLSAYINGAKAPMHHLHVKAGDNICFKLDSHSGLPAAIDVEYNGTKSSLSIWPEERRISSLRILPGEQSFSEENIMTPAETVNLFAGMGNQNQTGGAMGAGLGAGILGGVLGGALLGNNGVLGGRNGEVASTNLNIENAVAASERLTNARFDAQGQRDIEASIERTAAALGVEIVKGQGEINTQNALNAAALGVQIAKTSGDTQTQIALQTAALGVQSEKTAAANALAVAMGLQTALQANAQHAFNASQQLAAVNYGVTSAIKADGDQTRALITTQYQDTLNRQLVTAQNEIIELRGDQRLERRTRETEVNVTQVVNQNQAQAQQQQQFQVTANLLQQLLTQGQIANATNQQLIIGNTGYASGGNQTANPVNVRA